jgi:hypothetical protein
MKKNRLSGCLHQGQKNIGFDSLEFLTIDGRNMIGPWVIKVREFESGYRSGFKGQKNIDFGIMEFLAIDDWNIARPWIIGVGESEPRYRSGFKGKKTSISADSYCKTCPVYISSKHR